MCISCQRKAGRVSDEIWEDMTWISICDSEEEFIWPPYIEELTVAPLYPRTFLPKLPENLKILHCEYSRLESLPELPKTLIELYCEENHLTTLSKLPDNLQVLDCGSNGLSSLPKLPSSLRDLYCEDNLLLYLPILPPNLETLYCNDNPLLVLPGIPSSLIELACWNTKIVELPKLPSECDVDFDTCTWLKNKNNPDFNRNLQLVIGLQRKFRAKRMKRKLTARYLLKKVFPTLPPQLTALILSY